MIKYEQDFFHLSTEKLSYIIGIRQEKYLEHLYFGKKIECESADALQEKMTCEYGNSIVTGEGQTLTLDNICLEFSSTATGDFRDNSLMIRMPDGSYSNRFQYKQYSIYKGVYESSLQTGMPYAKADENEADTLDIMLSDEYYGIELHLIYTVFENSNVITMRRVICNRGEKEVSIEKCMSLQLDIPESDYYLETLDGAWARERHVSHKELVSGIYVNESTTGNSSSRHNPFILIGREGCNEKYGECIGINIIYSGNHKESIEVSPYEKIRIMTGINSYQFKYELKSGDTFYTPEAVLTFSECGKNQLSHIMHKFIRHHIIPERWDDKERPVLINNWEATYFDFSAGKLLKLAKEAKELGIELFVLDDGWFGKRNDDKTSLGDWQVNEKKLGGTLKSFADKINQIGLDFGIWMEPEMISEQSELFKIHPEFAVKIDDRIPYLGRNQYVLDYTNKEVRDYIVECISNVLASANISYVKWDMNRQISDAFSVCGGADAFYHKYILGLYEVLERITSEHPDILFESCAAGGNRFDLGMMCYMPQAWTSDDTDANERVMIQEGTSYGYPLCTMGSHVSAVPNHQTLRNISLETRFNVACFGLLGYELDITKLTASEKKVIKKQIEFYKENRQLFQYGTFSRERMHNGNVIWQVVSEDKEHAVAMVYQQLSRPNISSDILKIQGLDESSVYEVTTRKQAISIKEFGSLVNQVSPIGITEGGVIQSVVDKMYMLECEQEKYKVSGGLLMNAGIKLSQRFIGTGYDGDTRVMGDFSSRMYVVNKIV